MGGEHAAVAPPAGLRLGAEHDRAGAVAEEDAGRAIGPVEDAREGLGADDQRLLRLAGRDHARRRW